MFHTRANPFHSHLASANPYFLSNKFLFYILLSQDRISSKRETGRSHSLMFNLLICESIKIPAELDDNIPL